MPLNDNTGRVSGVPAGGYQPGTATGPNIPQNVRSTGAGTYTRPGVANIEVVDPLLEGYVFNSGLEDPAVSKYLSIKYPQYTLTALLDRLGRSEGIANSSWSWFEMDRTRRGGSVLALQVSFSTTTAPTLGSSLLDLVIVTDIPAGDPYFVVGDIIRLASGVNLRVNEVGTGSVSSVSYQALRVTRQDGGAFSSNAVITPGITFGHAFNSWGEGSNGPGVGRAYFPEERYNKLNILRRSLRVTGNTLTQRTRIGDGKSWYYTAEDIEMKEFARDRELAILTGQMTPDGAAIQNGDGILSMVENQGTVTTFTGAMTESALQSHILSMMYKFGSSAKEYVCLCGMDFMADVTNALKHYFIGSPSTGAVVGGSTSGGVSYGSFGNVNVVGLDLVSYRYMGKTIHFVHYEMFDDPAVFPFRNTGSGATANRKSYSGSGLFLDMGSDSAGNKLVTMKHRELNGENRKFIHKIIPGMHQGSNGLAANSFDGFQIEYLSEVGVEVRVPGRHGFMTRVGS